MAYLQRKDDTYYLVDKAGGRARWIRLGRISFAEARAVCARYETDKTYLRLGLAPSHPITFRNASDEYLAWAANHKAASTVKSEGHLLRPFGSALGGKKLGEVSQRDLEENLFKKKYAPHYCRLRINALRALYRFAIERGYVKENAAAKLKRPRIEALPPKYVEKERLRAVLEAMSPKTRAPYEVMFYTGMRPGEVLRLEKKDVDFRRREIRVERTKTGRPRVIPMHPRLVEILKPLQDGRLFPQGSLRDGLKAACKRSGVTVTPYQFRHSFATAALEVSRDIRAVQQLLGHASIQQTTRYATALEGRLREAVEGI